MTKSLSSKKDAKHARRVVVRDAADAARSDGDAVNAFSFSTGRVTFLLVAVAALVYANSLGGQFLFDDTKQIVNNAALHSWANVLKAFTSDVWSFQRAIANDAPPPYYRPLFTAYTTLVYQLFGLWTQGWHLLSLAVHCAATVLVFKLIKRLSANVAVATGAALLFAVHPAHVESVAWVSGVPDALAALFFIPALIWFARYRQENKSKWLALSVVAYALSLLCKETAITLPLVVFVWDLTRGATHDATRDTTHEGTRDATQPLSQRLKRVALACVPFIAVACAYLLVRVAVLGAIGWTHPLLAQTHASSFLLTAPSVLAGYFQHLVAPFYLSLLYGTRIVSDATDVRFLLPALMLVALAVLLWLFRRRLNGEHWTALALIVAPLLPVLNLKALHPEYEIQDRYLYLPSIGLCWLAASACASLARRRRTLALSLAALVLVAFGASTVLQNRVWDNGVALWSRAVSYAPDSGSAHYNLGLAFMQAKDYAAAKSEFLTSARISPDVAVVYNNLALAEDALGDSQSATESLRRAIKLDPKLAEAHNNLGAVLFRRGEYAAARAELNDALKRDPTSSSVRYNLARTLAAAGDHAAAIPIYESLLASNAADSEVRFHLGLSYAATGQKSLAVSSIERALQDERVPERAAEMREQLNNLRSAPQR
jgi:protein O-mannosyl-transferase